MQWCLPWEVLLAGHALHSPGDTCINTEEAAMLWGYDPGKGINADSLYRLHNIT
jgi:hypothetical protein